MLNIKDVWEKTNKIRALRSKFSQDFGTTILEDKLENAKNDPNRRVSLLRDEHKNRLQQEYQNLAQELAQRRSTSINTN